MIKLNITKTGDDFFQLRQWSQFVKLYYADKHTSGFGYLLYQRMLEIDFKTILQFICPLIFQCTLTVCIKTVSSDDGMAFIGDVLPAVTGYHSSWHIASIKCSNFFKCRALLKIWLIGSIVCTGVANSFCAHDKFILVFISRVVKQRGK